MNTPRKSTRREEGVTNVLVQTGNVWVNPGDLVFADNDGVLFLAPESIQESRVPPNSQVVIQNVLIINARTNIWSQLLLPSYLRMRMRETVWPR
jgi:regulator of RNase E activity RraA